MWRSTIEGTQFSTKARSHIDTTAVKHITASAHPHSDSLVSVRRTAPAQNLIAATTQLRRHEIRRLQLVLSEFGNPQSSIGIRDMCLPRHTLSKIASGVSHGLIEGLAIRRKCVLVTNRNSAIAQMGFHAGHLVPQPKRLSWQDHARHPHRRCLYAAETEGPARRC